MKYAPEEGLKAYGLESSFMVQSVVVAPKLKNATAEQRQMTGQNGGGAAFRQVLEKACEKQQKDVRKPQNITCYTMGYTRNAQPFIYQVEQREYC